MPSIPPHRVAPDAGSLLSVTVLPGVRPGHVLIEVIGEVDTFTAPALELAWPHRRRSVASASSSSTCRR
jgi:hypothetical protein